VGALLSVTGVSFALISQRLIDAATGVTDSNLVNLGIIMGVVIIVQIVFQSVNSVMNARTLEDMRNSMRSRMIKKLMKSEWLPFSSYHSGDVVTRMTSDVSTVVGGVVSIIPALVALLVQLVTAFLLLFYFDPILALFALVLGPVFLLISRIFAPKLREYHIKTQEVESKSRSFIQEVLQNMLIVKVFGIEKKSSEQLDGFQKQHRSWIVKRNWLSTFSSASISLGFWAGYFLAFIWGSYRLSQGLMTFGIVVAFIQLIGQIQRPFVGLTRTIPRVISLLASAGRLIELDRLQEEEETDIEESYDRCLVAGVSIENVTYSYKENTDILKDVSLKVNMGEIIAITGTSGEGKTTLLRLLLALVMPDRGKVMLVHKNGDRNNFSRRVRRMVSYVPQANITFTGTIEENLKIGASNTTLNEINEALQTACALEFVNELPEKIKTVIGEMGGGLSEGQLQRLAIARALLRRAPILLLDEATSALDADTESRILKNMKKDNAKRIIFFVSHRPVVREYCGRVIRIDDGRMAEVL